MYVLLWRIFTTEESNKHSMLFSDQLHNFPTADFHESKNILTVISWFCQDTFIEKHFVLVSKTDTLIYIMFQIQILHCFRLSATLFQQEKKIFKSHFPPCNVGFIAFLLQNVLLLFGTQVTCSNNTIQHNKLPLTMHKVSDPEWWMITLSKTNI